MMPRAWGNGLRPIAGLAVALAVVAALGAGPAASAAEPVKQRQLVYSLSPWDSKEYGATFAPAGVDTIYLLAGANSLINPVETDVYYWPITREYMADWFGYRQEVEGRLEIRQGGRVVATLERSDYVFSYPDGYFSGEVRLVVGPEAQAEYQRYQDAVKAYYDAAAAYSEAQAKWQQQMDELMKRVTETGQAADPESIPEAPKEPQPPTLYVTGVNRAFVVNLPAGEYEIRTLSPEGQPVPGSERKLVVFQERRKGTGYQVIPESKWTYPVISSDPADVLYASGEATFYLNGFEAREFNQYAYSRMTALHEPLAGQGTRSGWTWVQGAELDGMLLEVLKDGKPLQTVERKPYYVQQAPGYALGYAIVDFDPEDPSMAGRQPSFEAFKVQVDTEPGATYEIRLVDAVGQEVPGSRRLIRAVEEEPGWLLLYGTPVVPLVLGLWITLFRRGPVRRRRGGAAGVEGPSEGSSQGPTV